MLWNCPDKNTRDKAVYHARVVEAWSWSAIAAEYRVSILQAMRIVTRETERVETLRKERVKRQQKEMGRGRIGSWWAAQ